MNMDRVKEVTLFLSLLARWPDRDEAHRAGVSYVEHAVRDEGVQVDVDNLDGCSRSGTRSVARRGQRARRCS